MTVVAETINRKEIFFESAAIIFMVKNSVYKRGSIWQ